MDWMPTDASQISDALYETYTLQSIRIPGAQPHRPSLSNRRRWLPSRHQSLLSAAVAGQHCRRWHPRPTRSSRASSMPARRIQSFLPAPGRSTRPLTLWRAAHDDAENTIRFRRGWFLGDGTGAGKGRQVAGIVLDNWLKVVAVRSGSASPTSSSRMRSAIGRRWEWSGCS